MLAMIDEYEFDLEGTSFDSIERTIDFKFAIHERLGNFNEYQNIEKYEEDISIKGTLIVKKQKQLEDFEIMAKKKQEVTLTLGNGNASTMLIMKLKTIQDSFLKEGLFLKQSYTISLQVVGDEDS